MSNTTNELLAVSGAYDARNEIKRVGGKWDAATKRWLITEAMLSELSELFSDWSQRGKAKRAAAAAWFSATVTPSNAQATDESADRGDLFDAAGH